MTATAIYARQSQTREGSESLEDQVNICGKAMSTFGLVPVVELVEPPSTSGYKNRGRSRPKFKELLNLIRSGEINAVMVFKSDRLSRGGGPGWAPLLDAAEKAGLDLDHLVCTPQGWMSEFEIGIRATMDRDESKKNSDRVTGIWEREAKKGKPRKGRFRPFGYTADYEVIEDEKILLNEAVDRVLQGEAVHSIAQDWNERGIKTTAEGMKTSAGAVIDGSWIAETLKDTLLNPRNIGMRSHKGKIVGSGTWEPLLSKERWEGVVAVLKARATYATSTPRSYPLTGFLYCDVCGRKLRSGKRSDNTSIYACRPGQRGVCGKVSIDAKQVEDHVRDLVIGTLTHPKFRDRILGMETNDEQGVSLADTLAALEVKKAKIVEALLEDDGVFRSQLKAKATEIQNEIDQAYRAAQKRSGVSFAADIATDPDVVLAQWNDEGIGFQRRMISVVISRIVVRQAVRGRRTLDPERLGIEKTF